MSDRWARIPFLRDLSPLWRGFADGTADDLVLWVMVALATAFVPMPSDQLFRDIAQIGATLLVAFAVEVSWLLKVSDEDSRRREEWVGLVTSSGVSGLLGIAMALVLAGRLEAGYSGWVEHLVFAWVVASIGMLGAAVALQPLLTYSWRREK
jgi:hypothetical protein